MALMQCPHCGAENFTMEGWEDLDHCSVCGKPLGEPDPDEDPDPDDTKPGRRDPCRGDRRRNGGRNVKRPRPA
jgi:hypothetical protein